MLWVYYEHKRTKLDNKTRRGLSRVRQCLKYRKEDCQWYVSAADIQNVRLNALENKDSSAPWSRPSLKWSGRVLHASVVYQTTGGY